MGQKIIRRPSFLLQGQLCWVNILALCLARRTGLTRWGSSCGAFCSNLLKQYPLYAQCDQPKATLRVDVCSALEPWGGRRQA